MPNSRRDLKEGALVGYRLCRGLMETTYLESQWLELMGYCQSMMDSFGEEWPVILGHLAFPYSRIQQIGTWMLDDFCWFSFLL